MRASARSSCAQSLSPSVFPLFRPRTSANSQCASTGACAQITDAAETTHRSALQVKRHQLVYSLLEKEMEGGMDYKLVSPYHTRPRARSLCSAQPPSLVACAVDRVHTVPASVECVGTDTSCTTQRDPCPGNQGQNASRRCKKLRREFASTALNSGCHCLLPLPGLLWTTCSVFLLNKELPPSIHPSLLPSCPPSSLFTHSHSERGGEASFNLVLEH